MELPETKLERTYRVRVYGTFTEEKLKKIRDGMTIAGVKYGPYWVKVENRYSFWMSLDNQEILGLW